MPYADVEALLTGWLATTLGVRCVTDLPANLQDVVPVVQVTRFGGGDDSLTLDRANVDIDCYVGPDADGNPDRAAARLLAERVRKAMRVDLAHRTIAGVIVGRVDTVTGPSERPYDNTSLRRFGASYAVTTHSPGL